MSIEAQNRPPEPESSHELASPDQIKELGEMAEGLWKTASAFNGTRDAELFGTVISFDPHAGQNKSAGHYAKEVMIQDGSGSKPVERDIIVEFDDRYERYDVIVDIIEDTGRRPGDGSAIYERTCYPAVYGEDVVATRQQGDFEDDGLFVGQSDLEETRKSAMSVRDYKELLKMLSELHEQ